MSDGGLDMSGAAAAVVDLTRPTPERTPEPPPISREGYNRETDFDRLLNCLNLEGQLAQCTSLNELRDIAGTAIKSLNELNTELAKKKENVKKEKKEVQRLRNFCTDLPAYHKENGKLLSEVGDVPNSYQSLKGQDM